MTPEVRKKVCLEKSLSRTTGILPYIKYGSETYPEFVTPEDLDGNWGNFPMDIAKMKYEIAEGEGLMSGFSHEDKDVVYRLRYCDIIRRYNRAQKILADAIYTKSIYKEEANGRVVEEKNGNCLSSSTETSSESAICLTTSFQSDTAPTSKYHYALADETRFNLDGNLYYPIEEIMVDDNSFPINSPDYVYEKPDLEVNTFFALTPDLDELESIAEWWTEQWEELGESEMFIDDSVSGFCVAVERYIIGKVETPLDIEGILVPEYVYYEQIPSILEWFNDHDKDDRTIEEQKDWDDHGGDIFRSFVEGIETHYITELPKSFDSEVISFAVPYISIPVSLEDEYTSFGTYESFLLKAEKDGTFTDATKPYQPSAETGQKSWRTEGSAYVESMINSVIDDDATEVNNVTGVWADFSESEQMTNMMNCMYFSGLSREYAEDWKFVDKYEDGYTEIRMERHGDEVAPYTTYMPHRVVIAYREQVPHDFEPNVTSIIHDDVHGDGISQLYVRIIEYEYGWWECVRLTPEDAAEMKCADGEEVNSGQKRYRTITLLECLTTIEPSPKPNTNFIFMVKKDNGYIFPLGNWPITIEQEGPVTFRIPFTSRSAHNVYSIDDEGHYVGDYVYSIDTTTISGSVIIQYVIGGQLTSSDGGKTFDYLEHTGILYEDIYPYEPNKVMRTFIDGCDNIRVFYDEIDYEAAKELIYNEELGLYRKVNRSRILGMEVGTMFTEDEMMTAPLFTREGSSMLLEDPDIKMIVEMERGNAAAFEGHFRLMECNTMSDLQNNGNNFFNI